ncbi:MAG: UDP binding domain-containing protein [Candidatus Nitrospinota bacterium M3_3B_026]
MKSFAKKDFLEGKARIGVWGAGFIGGTTAMAYASEGVKVICYDINPNVALDINRGVLGVTNLEYWFGATMKEFIDGGLIRATSDWEEMRADDIKAHFIAVPTEREGAPWDDAILDVLGKLGDCAGDLVIIESTLTPGRIDRMLTDGLNIGVAPRRDWFHSPDKNLKNLPRVFAGVSPQTTEMMREVLSIVCDNLLAASDHRVAELVKSVENALLHVPAVLATQLVHAYPDIDIDEVLSLAATHWRIPKYYPSFGTGGYCIPLSSKYVLLGSSRPESLSILKSAVEFDAAEPYYVAERAIRESQGDKTLVMGISYKGDLKVHELSPAIKIIERLVSSGRRIFVNDPYYSEEEISRLFNGKVTPYDIKAGLDGFDSIVIVTDHKMYGRIPLRRLTGELKEGCAVFDNYGIWKKFKKPLENTGVRYYKVGQRGYVDDGVRSGACL